MKSRPRWAALSLPSWPRTVASSRKATRSFVSSRSRASAARTSGGAAPMPPQQTGAVSIRAHGAATRLAQGWLRVRAMDERVRLAWVLVITALLLDSILVGQHALVRYQ